MRPQYDLCTRKIQVTERIFKLTSINVSVINQIPLFTEFIEKSLFSQISSNNVELYFDAFVTISLMLLVDGDRNGTGYITDIVYSLYIMQMIAELTNQSL